MATGEESSDAREPFKPPVLEEGEEPRPRAGPLREGEELAFARWAIPISARNYYEGLKILAEMDLSTYPGKEELKNTIERFKKGEITVKSLILELAKVQEKEYLGYSVDFEDYDPDSPYPMPEHSLFFPPLMMMTTIGKTVMNGSSDNTINTQVD